MTVLRFLQEILAYDEDVHMSAQETIDGLGGGVDYGLVLIERGVQEHWYACNSAKSVNKLPVQGINVLLDGLKASGPVFVGNGRNSVPLSGFDSIGLNHEGRGIIALKVLAREFGEN